MTRILARMRRLRFLSLNRGGLTSASERPVENTDALAAAGGQIQGGFGSAGHNSIPPNYVKSYDEGRPRH